jgi:hypothetical protein
MVELAVMLRQEELLRKREELKARSRQVSAEERQQLEPEIWRLAMLGGQLKECFKLRDWTKAQVLLEMIDLQ